MDIDSTANCDDVQLATPSSSTTSHPQSSKTELKFDTPEIEIIESEHKLDHLTLNTSVPPSNPPSSPLPSPIFSTPSGVIWVPPSLEAPSFRSRKRYNKFAEPIGATLKRLHLKVSSISSDLTQPLSPEPLESSLEESFEDLGGPSTAPLQPSGPSSFPLPHGSSIGKFLGTFRSKDEARRLLRKKMHRCKVCKNRFIEKDLFERHLKDRHPLRYEAYSEEKALKEEKDRLEHLEYLRRQQDRETHKNQVLAEIYERRLKDQAAGVFVGPPPKPEEVFPPRPPKPLSPQGFPSGGFPSGFQPSQRFWHPNGQDPSQNAQTQQGKQKEQKKSYSPQCPFCDKRYRNDSSFRKHLAKKHPECINFVQCNRCYKALSRQEELAEHDCEMMYICDECQPIRNMVTAERLFSHKIKFHRGEQSGFSCPECQRRFQTLRKLKKHQKLEHLIEKPFKCQFCDEYFQSDMAACVHERVHTGKVRFECNLCDFRAQRSSSLQEHKTNEHGYLCMLCSEAHPSWDELKTHTLEQHQGYLSVDSQACVIVSPRIWVLFKGE